MSSLLPGDSARERARIVSSLLPGDSARERARIVSSLLPGDSARGGGAKLLDRSRPEARFRKPTAVWSVDSLPGREIGTIRERFSYVRPEGLLRSDVADLLHECRPTPAIVDGINAAMAMHSLDLSKHFA